MGGDAQTHHSSSPRKKDPTYEQWRQSDSIALIWILENIESDIVDQYTDYPTSWDLWKGDESKYSSGKDPPKIYNLTIKANNLKQGSQLLEGIYSQLHSV